MKTYWQRITDIVGPARKENFNQVGQKNTRKSIEDFILKHTNKSSFFLDAGCNTGVEAIRLYEGGFKGKKLGLRIIY